jgi:hypothetical protein
MYKLALSFLFVLIAIIITYFFPAIVPVARRKRNWGAILALNLLAGWTFVGWVAALVWALTHDCGENGKKPAPPAAIDG